MNPAVVRLSRLAFFARSGIPQPNGLVIAARRKRLAVRRKGERGDSLRMTAQHMKFFSGESIPDANDSVESSTGEPAPIRRKCQGSNAAGLGVVVKEWGQMISLQ